mmetsp:Transcript_34472/g.94900  ORF Transcript_34472/g.94900 Transcript_34472/m.94900 type:complete len:272 (-) Transcript_34472:42-857(-)
MAMLRKLGVDMAVARHIWRQRNDPELQRLLQGTYVGRWPFWLLAGHVRDGFQQLSRRPPYPEKACQPKLFGDFVTNRPVWPSTCEVSRLLAAHVDGIRDDFRRLEKARCEDINTKGLTVQGNWSKVHLISHSFRHSALDECPTTRQVLNSIPFCTALGSAYFSILAPGTVVRPHFGPTNFRIRYHLGIEVAEDGGAWLQVADGMYRWHQGHSLPFSDAYLHAVRVDPVAKRRVVLIADIYHPDLTLREREFLEEIQLIHERYFPKAGHGAH